MRRKLIDYNYKNEEIDWLFTHLSIQKTDEIQILDKISDLLMLRFEAMAAPSVVFDVLISYISSLSRVGGYTSKNIWNQRLDELALDFSNLSGMVKQYGQTFFPIYHYKNSSDYESIRDEYRLGIDARPQHIRANLDISRPYWLNKISEGYDKKSIVLIRGASGQGKSTLAYRFLLDNFPERDIICIEKILSEDNAVEINSAINGMAKSRDVAPIIYIDVTPYDSNWIWLCEQIYKSGTNIKLLVTIREEDFRRTNVDYNRVSFFELELGLSKEEAQEIYSKYGTASFLTFDDAWKSFGEQGPLMEFVYLLNQSETLHNKLKAQIDAIMIEEPNSDEWLQALAIICYAGKNSIRIHLPKLFLTIECHQRLKMIKVFEKEYFIRQSIEEGYIECLHALRASILSEILSNLGLEQEDYILVSTLKSINHNALMMVVEYAYNNKLTDDLVLKIANIKYDTWQLYAGVLQAMLWGDVYFFYLLNKETINEGNKILNGTFAMIGLNDITGYLKNIDVSSFFDLIKKDNTERYEQIQEVLSGMNSRHLDYHYTDLFLQNVDGNLPTFLNFDAAELSPCGFSLFWMAKRNFFTAAPIKTAFLSINIHNQEDYLNFLVGIQSQKWWTLFEELKGNVERHLLARYNIVCFEANSDELHAIAINSIFSKDYDSNAKNKIMDIVDPLRKLYIDKRKYNVEMVGQNILDDVKMPDMEKHIPVENLPFTWITQLNRWLAKLAEYDNLQNTWPEVIADVIAVRKSVTEANSKIIRGLDSLYKNQNASIIISKDTMSAISLAYARTSTNKFQPPKCAVDRYGIRLNSSVVDKDATTFILGKTPQNNNEFGMVFNKYCSSLNNYYLQFLKRDSLIIERLNKKQPSNDSRLSLINLIDALNKIDEMQKLFTSLGNILFAGELDVGYEKSQLLLLSSMWDYIYHHTFFKNRSLSYQRKEYIKAFNKKLVDLFEKELSSMNGIINHTKKGKEIFLTIDAQYFEETCKKLFVKFKQRFPESQTLTFEGYLLGEYLTSLIIDFNVLEQNIPGGFIIKANNFILYDDADKFIKFSTPHDNAQDMEETLITASIKAFSNIQALTTIFKHSTQVNEKVNSLNSSNLQMDIYEAWKQIVANNAISPTINSIDESLTYTQNHISADGCSEIMAIYDVLKEMIRIIRDNLDELVACTDFEETQKIVNTMQNTLIKYLDLLQTA